MAIPAEARLVYRINALPMSRGFTQAEMNEVATAMKADTSGQFQVVWAIGNSLIYEWAPRIDQNRNANLDLHKLITTPKGIQFSAMNVTRIRGV